MKFNIVVVGCGGTGSYFIKEFGRFMAAHIGDEIRLGIVDGDRVEEKNLERQCFQEGDVGEFKCLIMAQALEECFGVKEVYAFPKYIDKKEEIKEIFHVVNGRPYYYDQTINILIGCVDNHRARQEMEAFYDEAKNLFYYDSANEYENGEVVFCGKIERKTFGRKRSFFFPDVLTDQSPRASEISCGAINASDPQHMLTNMMAGNILLSGVIPLIKDKKTRFGICYFHTFLPEILFRDYEEILKEEKKRKRREARNHAKSGKKKEAAEPDK